MISLRAAYDDVVVTTGCQEAVVLCLRAIARPGETIAVESPTFYGTLQAIRQLERNPPNGQITMLGQDASGNLLKMKVQQTSSG